MTEPTYPQRLMPAIDAAIFEHLGDVALIRNQFVKGIFNNRYREVRLQDGTIAGLAISFDCQYSVLIADLAHGETVRIAGIGYQLISRIPPQGDDTGLVTLGLGTMP